MTSGSGCHQEHHQQEQGALPRLHREGRGEAAQRRNGAPRRQNWGHAEVSQEGPWAEGGPGGELDRGQDQDQGGLQGDRGAQPVNYDRTT